MSFGTMSCGTGPHGTSYPTTAGALVLSNAYPSSLAVIAPLDTIGFDVTAPGRIRRILVFVEFPALAIAPELVYDGAKFQSKYVTSTVDVLTDKSRRFAVRHGGGGWPSRPNLRVFAFDRLGQEL